MVYERPSGLGGINMEKNLVCPCGLTCCDCLFYKKEIYETAYKLKELITGHELNKFLIGNSSEASWEHLAEHMDLSNNQIWDRIGSHFDVFKHMPEFMDVLDGIIELQCKTTCQESGGCSIGGNTHECKALKCIKSKGYEGCWQCNDFESCDKLKFLKHGYGYVIEDNLRTIKEKGIDAVKSRGNKYYAWQRK
jgi:biotin operon repressor